MLNDMLSSGNSLMNESRWATADEIKSKAARIDLNENKYPTAGLPAISDAHTAYVDGSDTHTIIFGSTGSKKSRLFCMPMLNMMIRAGESFIVTDPKGELYQRTAGAAKKNGYKNVVLNFRDIGLGDCWNPLHIPYDLYHHGDKESAIGILNDFIAALSEEASKRTYDIFWVETARALGLANMLLLMECGEKNEVHMGSLASLCSNANIENVKQVADFINPDSIAGINYNNVFSSADKTMQSIQISLYSWMRIFITQKKLTKMLSTDTFDMRSFGREKTAVYIIVPDEKTTYHFLVTTFIKQVYEMLINEAQKEVSGMLPVRVNFVLDEFCNMPRVPDMPSMISAARSRNMRYFLIVQGMHQLRSKYGDDAETIKGNCENWVFLTSKELALLNEISELCGTITIGSGVKRRLISPSELQRLDKDKGEVLMLFGRKYPFIIELPDIDEYKSFESLEADKIMLHPEIKYRVFSSDVLLRYLKHTGTKLFEEENEDSAEESFMKRQSRMQNEEERRIRRKLKDYLD